MKEGNVFEESTSGDSAYENTAWKANPFFSTNLKSSLRAICVESCCRHSRHHADQNTATAQVPGLWMEHRPWELIPATWTMNLATQLELKSLYWRTGFALFGYRIYIDLLFLPRFYFCFSAQQIGTKNFFENNWSYDDDGVPVLLRVRGYIINAKISALNILSTSVLPSFKKDVSAPK